MGFLESNDPRYTAASTAQRRAAAARTAETAAVPAVESMRLWVALDDDTLKIEETLGANGYLWVYAYEDADDVPGASFAEVERTQLSCRDLLNRYRDRPEVGIALVHGRGAERKITDLVMPQPRFDELIDDDVDGLPTAQDAR